jgi:hypothetical protein
VGHFRNKSKLDSSKRHPPSGCQKARQVVMAVSQFHNLFLYVSPELVSFSQSIAAFTIVDIFTGGFYDVIGLPTFGRNLMYHPPTLQISNS